MSSEIVVHENGPGEIASGEERSLLRLELQSATEAFETSKEELQSINEELTTVNAQLQSKIFQLEATTNDIANLLTSTDIAVVFLDDKFRVRRFTPAVTDLLELIDTDVGRPVTDLAQKFHDGHLLPDARNVLQHLVDRFVAGDEVGMRALRTRTF